MTYRLHVDIPINGTEEDVIRITTELMRFCFDNIHAENHLHGLGIECVNFRLGNDEDRQMSNYLSKNENGHVGTKKGCLKYVTEGGV